MAAAPGAPLHRASDQDTPQVVLARRSQWREPTTSAVISDAVTGHQVRHARSLFASPPCLHVLV